MRLPERCPRTRPSFAECRRASMDCYVGAVTVIDRPLNGTLMMPAQSQPPNRIALVTGGAHRIGRAITLELAAAGYAVAVHARRSRDDAQELCRELVARGGRAAAVFGDLADRDTVVRLIPEATSLLGPLTLLVNNANDFSYDDFPSLDWDAYDRQFAVGLRAPLFLAKAFAAQAPRDGTASVVNLLDQRVYRQMPEFFSYGLAKSALFAATAMLAQALAPDVRVNGVAPGPTLRSELQTSEDFERQQGALPLGHGPNPQDVAQAVLYLATAHNVTGETIAVDGGQHLSWQTRDEAEIAHGPPPGSGARP
jgi:NAD(P)-dependent dehydrogenase (short-subunit alcohol dehydrogenase family)